MEPQQIQTKLDFTCRLLSIKGSLRSRTYLLATCRSLSAFTNRYSDCKKKKKNVNKHSESWIRRLKHKYIAYLNWFMCRSKDWTSGHRNTGSKNAKNNKKIYLSTKIDTRHHQRCRWGVNRSIFLKIQMQQMERTQHNDIHVPPVQSAGGVASERLEHFHLKLANGLDKVVGKLCGDVVNIRDGSWACRKAW